jgi:hypothetical protein
MTQDNNIYKSTAEQLAAAQAAFDRLPADDRQAALDQFAAEFGNVVTESDLKIDGDVPLADIFDEQPSTAPANSNDVRLLEIKKEIGTLYRSYKKYIREATDETIRMGSLLLEVKKHLRAEGGRRRFQRWIEVNCPFKYDEGSQFRQTQKTDDLCFGSEGCREGSA